MTTSDAARVRFLRAAARAAMAGVLALSAVPRAHASCNAIPGIPTGFRAAAATVDRPFASPGTEVKVSLDGTCTKSQAGLCGGVPCAPGAESRLAVTIVFTPPAGPRNVVVLATDCAPLAAQLSRCAARREVASAVCRQVAAPAQLRVESERVLRFAFPDTDDLVPPAGDGLTLTGPATIAVTAAGTPLPCALVTQPCATQRGLLACADVLSPPDGTCSSQPHPTFPHFTALPPANDFRALCDTPGTACTAQQNELRFTVDATGNLLLPVDWSAALPGQGVPIAGRVLFTTALEAFEGQGVPITIPFPPPDPTALASFAPTGNLLDPRFEPKLDPTTPGVVRFFGTIDAPLSIIRIARNPVPGTQCVGGTHDGLPCAATADCPRGRCLPPRCSTGPRRRAPCTADADCAGGQCGPGLFDFGTRLLGGVGPVTLRRGACLGGSAPLAACTSDASCRGGQCGAFDADSLGAAPLDALAATNALDAVLVPERLESRDLNADGDLRDEVVQLADRVTGALRPIGRRPGASGRAGLRVHTPPFAAPALVVDGDVLAFLEPEPFDGNPTRESLDRDGDGDAVDTILRVFRLLPDRADELTATLSRPLVADAAPVLDGRSLAVANGVVWFRASEAAAARHRTVAVTAPGTSASFAPSLSTDGRQVAFTVAQPPDTAPLDADRPAVLDRATGQVTRIPDPFAAIDVASASQLSATGRFLAFLGFGAGAPDPAVVLHDRTLGTSTLADVDAGGAIVDDAVGRLSLSGDGRFVAFDAGGTATGPYVRDPVAGVTVVPPFASRVDFATGVRTGTCDSGDGSLSADGRFVAFRSGAPLPGDPAGGPCGEESVLLYDRDADQDGIFDETGATTTTRASLALGGLPSFGSEPVVSGDGRFVAFASFASNLVAGDLNDRQDIFVRDRATGTTTRVSLESSGLEGSGDASPDLLPVAVSNDGRWVAFVSAAPDLVAGDTNGAADVFVNDRTTGITERASVSTAGAQGAGPGSVSHPAISADGQVVAFQSDLAGLAAGTPSGRQQVLVRAPDDADRASDLSGDGDVRDIVLQAFDPRAGTVRTLCPATAAAIAGDTVAFLRPEAGGAAPGCPPGPDLNGDGDADDLVVHLARGAGPVTNLGRAATAIAVSTDLVAALVSEAAEGGADRNGDGDVADTVVEVQAVTAAPGTWTPVGQAADDVAVVGQVVAFSTPESAQGVDLNGDGDLDDRVLQVYDAATNTLVDVGQAVDEFVLGDGLLAFRTPEAAQGEDLNADGDLLDDVLQVYDVTAGRLVNTGEAAVACSTRQPTCDPRVPYKIVGGTVRFITAEADQGGADLNDDGVIGAVKQLVDVRALEAGARLRFARAALAPTGATCQAVPRACIVLGAVVTGVCSTTGAGCFDDRECGGGTCYLPPGNCLVDTGTACDANRRDRTNPCGGGACTCPAGQFCAAGGAPGAGTCRGRVGTCVTDADCQAIDPTAVCTDGGATFQPLVDPFGGADDGVAFTSVGRCDAPGGGACVRDADCPSGSVCGREPVIATAADLDHDGLPDAVDTCPLAAGAPLDDSDGDGIGDACDADVTCGDGVVDPVEQCDDGNRVSGDGCDANCAVEQSPVPGGGCVVDLPGSCWGVACVLRAGATLHLPDADGNGLCEWPSGKSVLGGTLRFRGATPIEFVGSTIVEADAIVVEPGGVIAAAPETARRLTLVALTGDLALSGPVDLRLGDDLMLTAKRGDIVVDGPLTTLSATDRLEIRTYLGDVAIRSGGSVPPEVVAGTRIEVGVRGDGAAVEVDGAHVQAPYVTIDARRHGSTPVGKPVTLRRTVVTTDPLDPADGRSSGDIAITGGGRVAMDAVTLSASRRVRIGTSGPGSGLCVTNGSLLEAVGPLGPGQVDVTGVQGFALDDGTGQIGGVLRGTIGVGPCPDGSTPTTTTTTPTPTTTSGAPTTTTSGAPTSTTSSAPPTTSAPTTTTSTTTTTLPSGPGLVLGYWSFYVRIARTTGSNVNVDVPLRQSESRVPAEILANQLSAFALGDRVTGSEIAALGGDTVARLTAAADAYIRAHPADYPAYASVVELRWAARSAGP